MCCSPERGHIFLWSAAIPISMVSTWTLNFCSWGMHERWKDALSPIWDGIYYSGKWYPNEWAKGMLSDIVHQTEMDLKFHLQHLPKDWTHSHVRSMQQFGAVAFHITCQLVQHAKIKHCQYQGEKFCKCARNYNDPCETHAEQVRKTVWSSGFSSYNSLPDGAETKEMSFYSFYSFILWDTLLLLTCLKHPSDLIYVAAPQGSKPSPEAWEI